MNLVCKDTSFGTREKQVTEVYSPSASIPVYPSAAMTYTRIVVGASGPNISESITITVTPNLSTLTPWSPFQVAAVTIPQPVNGTFSFSFAVGSNKKFSVAANGGLSVCPTNGS